MFVVTVESRQTFEEWLRSRPGRAQERILKIWE